MSKFPIYLIGFMACGKSKVGKRLAKELNLDFIDLDDQIEMDAEKSITDIFEREGEKVFRKMEQTALKQTAGKRAIVALGGGTVCYFDNMNFVKENGTSIYLNVSKEKLYGRLRRNKNSRPLVRDLSDEELKQFVDYKLKERERFYLKADFDLSEEQQSVNSILKLIDWGSPTST